MNRLQIKKDLQQFFLEDIGMNDLSSNLIFSNDEVGTGFFVAKQDGVLCGGPIIEEGYRLLDPSVEVNLIMSEGEYVKAGEKIAKVKGPIAVLLNGERVILNLIQRMSGIATLTRKAVETLNSDHTRICDTRKTTPGLRMYEKYAVRCGGGFNHRFRLDDGVMIKDNHIAYMGSITKAVSSARKQTGHMTKIEVETESAEQVQEAVDAGADIIMFDNRTPEEIKELIELVPQQIITEASGGINLENLAGYQDTGVDYISLGCLTHSVTGLDISFVIEEEN
ncbi:carboxylating nicotinate-nucleotide diphosphorylase [Pseudalkalibacillus caeni]|uniref:Probable nicotinate-nucleotide pyrophosphorylase [carboxylating] n=1 Tax=Exobacillus caeni TaxID=2574798 RepID=A0A5R9F9S1_9BACL|nr:carboxylating nicotinate-nucleotide diphosphorylase [Pseudalkalibacillus caeni]TLS39259.1 carboxylating nicotinate-nucleotide diphosphorylase [Pseudalkalibacillus caeni]